MPEVGPKSVRATNHSSTHGAMLVFCSCNCWKGMSAVESRKLKSYDANCTGQQAESLFQGFGGEELSTSGFGRDLQCFRFQCWYATILESNFPLSACHLAPQICFVEMFSSVPGANSSATSIRQFHLFHQPAHPALAMASSRLPASRPTRRATSF